MVLSDEFKLRQLIWTEYRAGKEEQHALINIKAKIGDQFVSESIITYWYNRFRCDELSLFERSSSQHGISHAIQTFPNSEEVDIPGPISFITYNGMQSSKIIDTDGRFAIFLKMNDISDKLDITFYDLFHSEEKATVTVEEIQKGVSFTMIGDQHILVRDFHECSLLKIDSELFKVDVVSKPNLSFGWSWIVVDQLNRHKFLINDWFEFATGSLIGDEIVCSGKKTYDIHRLNCPKLTGNHLFGLKLSTRPDDSRMWKYQEVDLITLNKKSTDMPSDFCCSRNISNETNIGYIWADKRLYFIPYRSDFPNYIALFDTESFTWRKIGITVFGRIDELFVDKEHFLTLQACRYNRPKMTSSIYRVALKSPDSLKNIVWFAIRRYAVLFDGNLYDKVRTNFPVHMP